MIGCFVMSLLSAIPAANHRKNAGYLQSLEIFLKIILARLQGGR